MTSNPTIFEKGMGHTDRYDDAFREAALETDDVQEIFERLAYADVRDAADLLRPVFEWNHHAVMRKGGEGLARRLGAQLLARS